MNVYDFAYQILSSETLNGKLLSTKVISSYRPDKRLKSMRFISPVRGASFSFSTKQVKFPKKNRLKTKEGTALALNGFANHELLAIEMIAQAILLFPDIDEKELRNLVLTLSDEQKHFTLYNDRLINVGFSFGDFPLNRFFWNQMKTINSFDKFYVVMAMTFEQANLDFAKYYRDLFYEIGDDETGNVLNIVYEDEINHLARGRKYLENTIASDDNLWDYYLDLLPENLSANRAKGIIFDQESRRRAGLSDSFINKLENYKDSFNITTRKEWKK